MREAARGRQRPNIVLMLADDMGFADIGCFGSEIRTPSLDRLAAGGARLTQMYNCARCCPSRASLLTGLYPHQAGVGHMVNDLGLPGYRGYLGDGCATIAELLGAAGYRTAMSGKWHVGGNYAPDRPESWRPGEPGYPLPTQRGFEHHFGTLAGAGSYFRPPTLMRDGALIEAEGDFYYTEAIGADAAATVRAAASQADPFFLYMAFTAPHWPLHAREADIATYEGRYSEGWTALRTARHETLLSEGLLNPGWAISPQDAQAPAWTDLPPARREWEAWRMAVYAAQVTALDRSVGTVLQALAESGAAEDTLILFVADNGGCAELLREDGGSERYRLPGPDGRPVRVGNIPGLRPGGADTFMSYDLPWANASNTPFRLYKHWVHEGGIATPCVVHWPARVPAGETIHAPAHFIDVLATCLDAAGVPYPAELQGRPLVPLEGESLLPALTGQCWRRERPLFWEHEGNRAVRMDNWKLVSRHPGAWELYDMDEDRTELHDRAATEPQRVAQMADLYAAWAGRANVTPWERLRRR